MFVACVLRSVSLKSFGMLFDKSCTSIVYQRLPLRIRVHELHVQVLLVVSSWAFIETLSLSPE